ncbi:MAG: phage virion morphogenesis protein [Parvibaculum sp.]|uniref:phage virion morphogenesis protein n=1 Tax=Parvibaculum sp. TaxID=2024848 RepID=UPI002724531E|nr:phage virion morphogenesis protein [Parvibaculum sp.]MDO8838020.1 phage virion morphogenesis protein [Parvibaculum sp.]
METGLKMSLTLEDAAALAGLEAMALASRDMTPAMEDIGLGRVTSTQRRFDTGIGPDGVPWPVSMRAAEEGGLTLVDSARLYGSITFEAGPQDVAWGTDVAYAGVHQDGATIEAKGGGYMKFSLPGGGFAQVRSVTIPARPFMGFDEEDAQDSIAALSAFVTDAFGQARGAPQ